MVTRTRHSATFYMHCLFFTLHISKLFILGDVFFTVTLYTRERVLGIQNDSVNCLMSDCSAVDNSDDSGETDDAEVVRGTYETREE
jgi:hypothetical protein